MKTNLSLPRVLVAAIAIMLGALTTSAIAAPSAADQAKIDQLKATYPLDTCPVSGDKLSGSAMGDKPVDYLYTQTNADGTQTTRLVRFCCKDCLTKFRRNPDKYLKTIDAAQQAKDKKAST